MGNALRMQTHGVQNPRKEIVVRVEKHVSDTSFAVNNDVVIHLLLIFMGVCILVAAFLAATQDLPFAPNPILMRYTTGYLGIPFAILFIAYNVHRIVNRHNAILIDENGVTDHTTSFSAGFIAWDDIKEVYLLRLHDDDYMCVVPADFDTWYATLNKRQQRLAKANMDAGFAPIRIQFKKVTEKVKSKEGVAFCKKIQPKKVSRVRKPKY